MSKICFVVLLVTLGLFSCKKVEETADVALANQWADSMFQEQIDRLRASAADDLSKRSSIELKPKVDSLLGRAVLTPYLPELKTDTVPLNNDTVE